MRPSFLWRENQPGTWRNFCGRFFSIRRSPRKRWTWEKTGQKQHLSELVRFYETGGLEAFNRHCILWVQETSARIDAVNGFIEVYHDPLQKKGSYESVVSMKDLEASRRIAAISREAQWFEDHSPIAPAHKKRDVVGISAKVITVLGEVGDAAP